MSVQKNGAMLMSKTKTPNLPSKTGLPSGKGRGNAPVKTK